MDTFCELVRASIHIFVCHGLKVPPSRYGQVRWPLPRKVITRGILNEPSLEIMPPQLKVYLLVDDTVTRRSDPVLVTMSSKDTVKTLVTTLAKAVRTADTDRPTRVWKLAEGESPSHLEVDVAKVGEDAVLLDADGRKTLEDALIDSGDGFVVEFQTEEGWLVPDSETQTQPSGASTPQSTSSAAPSTNRIFGPSNFFDRMGATSAFAAGYSSLKSSGTALKPAVPVKTFAPRAKVVKTEPGTLGLGNMCVICHLRVVLR